MKLRTIIFIILLALGILPILTLVGVNLRAHINQHETVETKRTAAAAESSFVSLNARVKCIKKSLLQAAATPLSAGLTPSSLDPAGRQRLAELLRGQLHTEKMILGVRLLDPSGNQLISLRRNSDSLEAAPTEAAHAEAQSQLLQKGLALKTSEVDTLLTGNQADPAATRLSLATPIPAAEDGAAGVLILENLDLSAAEPGDYTLACLPLLLPGLEASPVRAVLLR